MNLPSPADFDALSPEALEAAYARLVALEADLRVRLLTRRAAAPPPDRAVGLEEAARMLGCSRAWLGRRANWAKLGGRLDVDRRVKFPLSTLQAHLQGRR